MALIDLSLLFLLSFTGCCVGLDILPDGPVDVILGKNVTLNILYAKKPDDILVWGYSDGKDLTNIATLRQTALQVNAPYKGRVIVNTTNGYLTINSLKPEDSGDYSLNILTGDGPTLTGEIKVRVLQPVSNVDIKSNLLEAIELNSTVVLTCSSKGSLLTFSWTNKSQPIVPDERVTVKHGESSSNLTITGVLRNDLVGPIVCTAANQLEKESSAPFNLTVYYGPEDVTIKASAPSSEYVPSRSDFNLTCLATSSPVATFTWFHDEKDIKATGNILTLKTIEDQGLGKTKGNYKCVALNAKTKREVPSAVIQFSVMEPISGITLTGPTGILIAGNSSANLSCQATAGNVTDIMWLKDGKTLSSTSLVVFSSDRSSIFIEVLQKEDNGNYTCQLMNSVSKQEAHFSLVVNYGPESPEVKGKSQVELDGAVEFTCSVLSVPPAKIIWKINGTVIPGQTTTVLAIGKAAYKDSGIYTCEASNAVTGRTISSSQVLSVKENIYEGLSDGAIAGIVIACLVAVGAFIALFFYCRQKIPLESPY